MTRFVRYGSSWTAFCLVLFGLCSQVSGAEPSSPRKRPLTASEVRAFADAVVPERLRAGRVPGAVFVVVHGGQVLLSQGYGQANIEQATPVDADSTLFRVGSVSKVVTATAIMELSERGLIDLDGDVRKMLPGGALALRFDEPVTVAQLLTHTAGFDASDIGDAARSASEMIPLERFVRTRMTAQVSRPGEFFRYTNHGYALLGYLAEVIDGRPFHEVVRERVFAPLDMDSSTFEQPAAGTLKTRLAIGYELVEDYRALPMDYSNVAPADALLTTGSDMARFMLAHLDAGNSTLLRRETVAEMHRTHFRYHPDFAGRALGLEEQLIGASRAVPGPRRLLVHTGGQLGFTSELLLFEDEGLGLFICLNRRDWRVRSQVFDAFFERFFPASPPAITPDEGVVAQPHEMAGHYERMRNPSSTFEAIGSLLEPAVLEVSVDASGALVVAPGGEAQQPLIPISSSVYVTGAKEARRLAAFRKDANGRATHVIFEGEVYQRTAWYASSSLQRRALAGCLLAFVLMTMVWPLLRWMRRRARGESRQEKAAGRLVTLISALHIVFIGWFIAELKQASTGSGFDYGLPGSMVTLLWLPAVTLLLTTIAIVFAIQVWRRRFWGPAHRLVFSGATLASTLFLVLLQSWNLVGT